jgi:hypothetical protein
MLGHTIDDKAEQLARLKGVSVEDLLSILGGKGFANTAQAELMARGGQATKLGRLAGSKLANSALRVVPGLSVAGAALGAADVVAGNDSLANKAMDATAMGIGGFLGSAAGPIGTAAGASLGKMASDATQFVLGGGKSAEQRKMEEALAALRGGQI